MNTCKICKEETENKIYCSEKCQHIGYKKPKIERDERICIFCKNSFFIRKTKKNKYCSRKCADGDKKNLMIGNKNSTSHTEEWKNKMSIIMKNKWKNLEYIEKVLSSRQEMFKLLDYPIGHDLEAIKKRKESIKKFSLEKYGTEHPFSSQTYRDECEKICIEKYGKTSYQIASEKIDKETIEKRRRTLIETTYGISYEEYEKKLSQKEKYYKEVRRTTESQPLHLLENYDKRGVSGQDTYHLDHIVPISYGFMNDIPPEIIGNISNLQFIYWLENIQKGSKYEEKDQDPQETT